MVPHLVPTRKKDENGKKQDLARYAASTERRDAVRAQAAGEHRFSHRLLSAADGKCARENLEINSGKWLIR